MLKGLLIVCMGNATKCVEKLTGLDKEYSGTLKLGEITPSYDAAEPISERRPWEHITGRNTMKVQGVHDGCLSHR